MIMHNPFVTPVDLGTIGEKIVVGWLTSRGYSCHRNTQQAGGSGIEATGPAKLLVEVKTSIAPTEPADATWGEISNMLTRACKLGYEAWLAKIQVNDHGQRVGDVWWRKLA